LIQEDRLREVVAHDGAEFQRDARAAGRAVADGERPLAVEELVEHVVADDPLVVLGQMSEEVPGLRVRGLVIQQRVGRLALQVRSSGEDEHLYRPVSGM
jgi:hypothetical protein